MTLARLLAVTLLVLVCTEPALCQQKYSEAQLPLGNLADGNLFFFDADFLAPAAAPGEPWRLIPSKPVGSGGNALDAGRLDQYRLEKQNLDRGERISQLKDGSATLTPSVDRPMEGDIFCLKIRSYVVARDSKDSDSVHPVGYSTCQPTSRYGLKTTDIRSNSADH